jgi:hypothetical protein
MPLSASELRETANNLLTGLAAIDRAKTLQDYIDKLNDLSMREATLHAQQLDVQRQLIDIANRERDVEKSRGDQFDTAIKSLTRKRSFGCSLKKLFTIGLARC